MHVKIFSSVDLNGLEHQAAESPRRRQHWNLHATYEDRCQRFFNAIHHDSYLRPHKHSEDQGPESLFAIKGLLALITFSEDGKVEDVVHFGDALYTQSKAVSVGVELPPGKWHTVVSLYGVSVLLEIKAGPFDPNSPKCPAPWAPEEGGDSASSYFMRLRDIALRKLQG